MKKVIALACLAILPASYVAAEGYQVNAQSAKQAGMGHVGVAMKLGAESMHFNPAGMVFMDNTIDLSAGVSGVFSKGNFTSGDYKHSLDNEPSTPLYVYAGFKIFDNLAAGVSLNTPYGSSINWGKDWRGAHLVQDISLQAFNIQPTVSWKIMDRLSIGAGLMMEFGNISLSRALIGPGEMTYLANKLIGSNPALAGMASGLLEQMSKFDNISAASVNLQGDAHMRFGVNIGAMFDINEKFTVGVSYRSKVIAKVKKGDVNLEYANREAVEEILTTVNKVLPLLGVTKPIALPEFNNATFSSQLPLPQNISVGLTYRPTNRWVVSGEVQFVGWGAYDQLAVNFYPQEELGQYDIIAPKKYKNSAIFRVGTEFAATKRLDVRFGSYFDQSPVDADYLNPETPSMNKLGLTAGLSFRPLEKLSIDFAFSYVTGFGRDGSYTDEYMLLKSLPLPESDKSRTFEGHYNIYALMPSIGISYAF